MSFKAALLVTALAGLMSACSVAQQSTAMAAENSPPAESVNKAASTADANAAKAYAKLADAGKVDSDENHPLTKPDIYLAAQAAGYKLVNQEGKQVFCKKERVTGSRLSTRTRCLTLDQMEEESTDAKDTINNMRTRGSSQSPEG